MTAGLPLEPVGTPIGATPRGRRMAGLAAALLMVALAGAGAWVAGRPSGAGGAPDGARGALADEADSLARAPAGVRVRVHVTNASGVRGLGRRATAHLRARGFDVVGIDTEREGGATVTQVLVHAGPAEYGRRVARALGAGSLLQRPDSARYVEVRVRLGRDWQPPPEAFRP